MRSVGFIIIALFVMCSGVIGQTSAEWREPDACYFGDSSPEGAIRARLDNLRIVFFARNDDANGVVDITFLHTTPLAQRKALIKFMLSHMKRDDYPRERVSFYIREDAAEESIKVWIDSPDNQRIDRSKLIPVTSPNLLRKIFP